MKNYKENIQSIPPSFMEKCQSMLDRLAKIADVPAALIMKIDEHFCRGFFFQRLRGQPL